MNLNALAVELEHDEARRHFLYRDTEGKWTIGVGHNLTDKGLSDAAIDFILREDILEATQGLLKAYPWVADLDDNRQRVLANMAFNMGLGCLSGFRLFLAAVRANDYHRAREEMLNSIWARQVGDRAIRLADLMWPAPLPSLPPVA